VTNLLLPPPAPGAPTVGGGTGVGVEVGVEVGVLVGVEVGVLVGVLVGVEVGVEVGVLVGVEVGVFVGVEVGVFVGVEVGVFVGVKVGVFVGVAVGVFVGVSVGVDVGVSVGVEVGVSVGVDVGVSVGVEVGVSVGVEVGVEVGVLVGVDVGVEVGVGVRHEGDAPGWHWKFAVLHCLWQTLSVASPAVHSPSQQTGLRKGQSLLTLHGIEDRQLVPQMSELQSRQLQFAATDGGQKVPPLSIQNNFCALPTPDAGHGPLTPHVHCPLTQPVKP